MAENNSYVIWLNDSGAGPLYTYAWGATKEEALAKYLEIFKAGVVSVEDAGRYHDALPAHRYLRPPKDADWGVAVPLSPGAELYDADGKLKENL